MSETICTMCIHGVPKSQRFRMWTCYECGRTFCPHILGIRRKKNQCDDCVRREHYRLSLQMETNRNFVIVLQVLNKIVTDLVNLGYTEGEIIGHGAVMLIMSRLILLSDLMERLPEWMEIERKDLRKQTTDLLKTPVEKKIESIEKIQEEKRKLLDDLKSSTKEQGEPK